MPLIISDSSSDDDLSGDDLEICIDPAYDFEPKPVMEPPYNAEKRKEIVEFWRSGRKGNKTLEQVQHRYKKVDSRLTLYRWESQLDDGD